MNIAEIAQDLFKELYPSNVIFLHAYKYFREQRYPGVGTKQFTDWFDHKKWMEKETVRLVRKKKNDEVSRKY